MSESNQVSGRRWNWGRASVVAALALSITSVGVAPATRARPQPGDGPCSALIDLMRRFPKDTIARKRALSCADRADSSRRAKVFSKLSAQMIALAQLPWMIPEYHDEQPLVDGSQFGPMAYIFASPYVSGFKHPW